MTWDNGMWAEMARWGMTAKGVATLVGAGMLGAYLLERLGTVRAWKRKARMHFVSGEFAETDKAKSIGVVVHRKAEDEPLYAVTAACLARQTWAGELDYGENFSEKKDYDYILETTSDSRPCKTWAEACVRQIEAHGAAATGAVMQKTDGRIVGRLRGYAALAEEAVRAGHDEAPLCAENCGRRKGFDQEKVGGYEPSLAGMVYTEPRRIVRTLAESMKRGLQGGWRETRRTLVEWGMAAAMLGMLGTGAWVGLGFVFFIKLLMDQKVGATYAVFSHETHLTAMLPLWAVAEPWLRTAVGIGVGSAAVVEKLRGRKG